jgi:hypothetical protein
MSGCKAIIIRSLSALLLFALAGCETDNQIAFYERAQTAIAVGFSPSATVPEPVELSVAYKREVYAVIPPVYDQNGVREAKSLISNYDVKAGAFWKGGEDDDLTISNGFATGAAAKKIAQSPEATLQLFGLVKPLAAPSKTGKILLGAVNPCLNDLRNNMADAGVGSAVAAIMTRLKDVPEYKPFATMEGDAAAQFISLYNGLTRFDVKIDDRLVEILHEEGGTAAQSCGQLS